MKLTAAAALVASIGLLAISAGPAGAAPPTRFDIPEECSIFLGNLVCIKQSGQFVTQATPSGVVTAVGKSTFHSEVYDGPGKQNQLLLDFTSNDHFNNVSRNGEPVMFHTRTSFTQTSGGMTCKVTSNFVQTGGEIRHEGFDIECS